MAVKVIVSKCPQNHVCPALRVCPTGALVQEGHKAPYVLEDKCIDCGKCAKYCFRGVFVPEES